VFTVLVLVTVVVTLVLMVFVGATRNLRLEAKGVASAVAAVGWKEMVMKSGCRLVTGTGQRREVVIVLLFTEMGEQATVARLVAVAAVRAMRNGCTLSKSVSVLCELGVMIDS
jgi:hypothetical protein